MRKLLDTLDLNPKPKNKLFLKIGLIFLAIFLAFSFVESIPIVSNYDPNFTKAVQFILPRTIDFSFSLFSLIGAFEVTGTIVVVITLLVFKFERKIIWSIGVFFAVMLLFELIGKYLLFHPGPPRDYFRYSLPFKISTVHLPTNYAYPSGHVGRTIFISIILLFMAGRYLKNKLQKRFVAIAIFIFAIVMAVSRIYLGEHWTTDVIGGILLGISMGLLALVYY